jgi:hypothetical protein
MSKQLWSRKDKCGHDSELGVSLISTGSINSLPTALLLPPPRHPGPQGSPLLPASRRKEVTSLVPDQGWPRWPRPLRWLPQRRFHLWLGVQGQRYHHWWHFSFLHFSEITMKRALMTCWTNARLLECCFLVFGFFAVLGLKLRTFILSHSTSPIFVEGFSR